MTEKEKPIMLLIKNKWLLRSTILSFFLVLSISLCIHVYISTRDIGILEKPLPQPTYIYDKHGNLVTKISGNKREGLGIEYIPIHLLQAVIAIEDHRFYDHHGVDFKGIARAMQKNIIAGDVVQGGSTLTQQLAKNVFLTPERTWKRKLEELFIALKIERTFKKHEILELYLNQIYFGEGAWGIKRASQTYFAKDPVELSVGEAALLAGLIRAPSHYSPVKNKQLAIERKNLVLQLMEEHGYISAKTKYLAYMEDINITGKKSQQYTGKHPYYMDYILEEAITEYGFTQNELLLGGYHIYTELDVKKQTALENIYQREELFPTNPKGEKAESAAIFIDPATGGIVGLIGGRENHTFRGYNRATQLKRQPGSTIKPLAVYTPALEKGYQINDWLIDRPINIGGYQPNNYDRQFRGVTTMAEAVWKSYNVPAVWLLNEIGLSSGIEALQRFQIPLSKQDYHLGLALGGFHEGLSPKHLAEAYTTFPNEGKIQKAHAIRQIVDAKGNSVVNWNQQPIQVTSTTVAQKMTYLLKGVVENGTGKNAQINGREVAGKTGSTQVPIPGVNGLKDQWFVGYSPEIVGAVWIGFDQTNASSYIVPGTSGNMAAKIFGLVVQESLVGEPAQFFNFAALNMLTSIKHQKTASSTLTHSKWQKKVEKQEKKKEKREKRWKRQRKNDD